MTHFTQETSRDDSRSLEDGCVPRPGPGVLPTCHTNPWRSLSSTKLAQAPWAAQAPTLGFLGSSLCRPTGAEIPLSVWPASPPLSSDHPGHSVGFLTLHQCQVRSSPLSCRQRVLSGLLGQDPAQPDVSLGDCPAADPHPRLPG